ncbi:tetratricopeptide repeat protein [Leifsonia aquatica]|uniref:tetratricopeptide repeat protein n=1 Tax=Leifsonia aquatica TaxID=144185 RepID=UPI00046896D1|nr:tetratricopeptide repeat protein [Leifsonia aquatica]
MPRTDPAPAADRPGVPDDVVSFEGFARALGALRVTAGPPSYDEIARRIGRSRAEAGRGGPPAKVTVYDCFRPDRRRLDVDLVHDIVLALTDDAHRADGWRHLAQTLNGARAGGHVVVTALPPVPAAAPAPAPAPSVPASVTLITGLPGVGKSTLARELATSARLPGGVQLIQLRGYHAVLAPAEPIETLRAVARSIGARGGSPATPDSLRTAIATALAARPAALVFDDAGSVADLVPVLPDGAVCFVTSRSALDGLEALTAARGLTSPIRRIELAPLTAEASAAVLAGGLGRADAHGAALDRLARTSGGIRLAIDLIVRFAHDHPEWTTEDLAERFDVPAAGSPIHPLLDSLYRALDPGEASALRRLSLFAAPVDARTLAAASPSTARALIRLRSLHLVEPGPGVALHDAVRSHAHARSVEQDPLSSRRAFAAAFAVAARDRLATSSRMDRDQALELHAAGVLAHDHGAHDELVELAMAASARLEDDGHWSEIVSVLERADAVAPSGSRGPLAEAMARSYEKLGRVDDSLASLHRAQRLGDERQPGRLWNIIGNLHRGLGRWDDARAAYRRAAQVARRAGNPLTEGRALGNEANLARLRGDLAESSRLFAQAWTVTERAGDEGNRTILRSNRAFLDAALGRFAAAETESRALLAEAPPGIPPAYHSVTLATALLGAGRAHEAVAALEAGRAQSDGGESFDVLPEIGALRAQALRAVGRLDEAERDARDAVAAVDGTGFHLPVADALDTLALIALDRGRTSDAASLARRALASAESMGDITEQARAHEVLGRVALAAGTPDEAARHLGEALRLLSAMGHERAARLSAEFAGTIAVP